MRQDRWLRQQVVVCKMAAGEAGGAEVLRLPRLAPELSCCLQDSGVRHPGAKSLRRNALGQKLSCCLQDREDAVFGPELAAAGGSAGRRPGAVRDTAASIPGCGNAISADCPGIPGGILDPQRSSDGDNRRGGAAGSRARCTPTAPADISMAGRFAHSTGIAVRPYRRLSHPGEWFQEGDLETAIECVLRPGRWMCFGSEY